MDYGLYIIWEAGIENSDEYLKMIEKKFDILSCNYLKWEKEDKFSAISRLYFNTRINKYNSKLSSKSENRFILVVAADKNPFLVLKKNINGDVNRVNKNISDLKEKIRQKAKKNVIHSTDTKLEFEFQVRLLLGNQFLENLYNLKHNIPSLGKPKNYVTNIPVNQKAFSSFEELVNFMNMNLDYVFLCGYNSEFRNSRVIDVLTENIKTFYSLLNLSKHKKNIFYTIINSKKYYFRLFSINDYSIDVNWQKYILKSRILNPGGYFMNQESCFFYSIFGELNRQKTYCETIPKDYLRNDFQIINFSEVNYQKSKKYRYSLLFGYFKANKYKLLSLKNIKLLSLIRVPEELIVDLTIKSKIYLLISRTINFVSKAIHFIVRKIFKLFFNGKLKT